MSTLLGSSRCRCSGCGRLFSSTTAFDLHRAGEYTNAPPNYGRRCLSADEMRAKRMVLVEFDDPTVFDEELRRKKWTLVEPGYWISRRMPREVVARKDASEAK